jgi:hypothetical protein
MEFPALRPTSRDFTPGDWPIKRFNAQSGAEIRILYGSQRTNMKLSLSYENISDSNAELFLEHYDEMKGTYSTFDAASAGQNDKAKTGWKGNKEALGAGASGARYRYEGPPQVSQVRPGVSTVTVNLIGVL